jgi:carbohydrate-binding DOMON domain-containing protein
MDDHGKGKVAIDVADNKVQVKCNQLNLSIFNPHQYAHTHARAHIHTRVHTRTHTRTHTHTNTHTRTGFYITPFMAKSAEH